MVPTQDLLRHIQVLPAASPLPQSTCSIASMHYGLERSPHPCQRTCRPHLWKLFHVHRRNVSISTAVYTNVNRETVVFVRKNGIFGQVESHGHARQMPAKASYPACHTLSASSILIVSVHGLKRAYTLGPAS